jgi:hypothetical protein
MAEIVPKFEGQLLAIFGLSDWHVLIHGVVWQAIQVVERVLALHYPFDFEVICKLDGSARVILEELLLIVWVGFPLDQSESLEASALIDREDERHIVHCSECIDELFSGTCRGRPNFIIN